MDKLGQINNDNHTVCYRTHTKSKTKLPEPTTYSYQKKVESFFLCAFEHRIEIGRESFCELDPTISLLHFTIENGILYDYSKNGTYVNGKRVVHNVPLHEGDQICFAIHTIFYYPKFLISDLSFKDPKELFSTLTIQSIPMKQTISPPVLPSFSPLEAFLQKIESESISLIQSIAPSIMIFLSTTISILIQVFAQKQTITSILLSSITTLLMSFSFLSLGLFNVRLQKRKRKQQEEHRNTMYQNYIEERIQEIQKAFHQYVQSFDSFKEELSLYPLEQETIPIQIEWIPLSLPSLPKVNYQTRNDPLYTYAKEQLLQLDLKLPIFREIQKGQSVWIQCEKIEPLFDHLSTLSNRTSKWVFLEREPAYSILDSFCIEEGYLSIRSYEQATILLSKTESYWIVTSDEALLDERFCQEEHWTLLYCSLKKSEFPFDSIISRPFFLQKKTHARDVLPLNDSIKDAYIRSSNRSYSFPVGLEKGKLIWIDLQEGHLLIAGTTGSGKSEFISSLLLFGTYTYSSLDFQYILIDFKGGAFGQAFYGFPHCAGKITNLETEGMERFLLSLQAEIEERQVALARFQEESGKPANIHAYREQGNKMAHLWIVVDEFAQLKSRFPDAMSDLKEFARIGRSLGIHLILATQKPAGIVDEQIVSNSKYRICLKVHTAADSREMLMHEGASRLNRAGEFILQEGSRDKEVKGRSFYIHSSSSCLDSIRYVNQDLKQESLLNWVRKKVEARQEDSISIVMPMLGECSFSSLWLLDWPKQKKVYEAKLTYGQSALILCHEAQEKIVDSICAHETDVYIMHKNFEWKSLYFLLKEKKRATLVVFGTKDVERIVNIPFLKIYCLTSSYEARNEELYRLFTYRILSSFYDIDHARAFMQTYKISRKEFPMMNLAYKQTICSGIWSQAENQNSLAAPYPQIDQMFTLSQAKNYFSSYVLGYGSDCLPLVWQRKRPLLIAYAQAKKEEDLFYLMQIWRAQDPVLDICVGRIDERADVSIIQIQEGTLLDTKLVENMDLAWFGAGFNDYAYTFHKRSILEPYEMILFQEESIDCGACLHIYE